MDLAAALQQQCQKKEAERASNEALAILERLAEEFPRSPHYRERHAQYYRDLHALLVISGRTDEAVDAYRRRIEVQETLASEFAERAPYHEQLAWVLVVCPYVELRDQERAVSAARRAVKMEPDTGTTGRLWEARIIGRGTGTVPSRR